MDVTRRTEPGGIRVVQVGEIAGVSFVPVAGRPAIAAGFRLLRDHLERIAARG